MVTILGIESTAHTFGIGIVKDGKIIANEKDMYTTVSGGIIPLESAKHHRTVADEIYSRALKVGKIKEEDIDAIAFSQGPGLPPCLLAGRDFARNLALKLKVPIVPVNHCVAHLEVGRLTGAKDPVLLYCSGANTQIISYAAGKYRIFGETLDIGVGNFIDNFARYAGLGFPGGPKIEKLALEGKEFIELPYSVKGMDIALSGILTNLRQKLEKVSSTKHNVQSTTYNVADLSYSLQETVFAMLVETAERALAHVGKKELLLGGGVACNLRLQEMAKIMCEERLSNIKDDLGKKIGKTKFYCPEKSLLVDNGAMIAYLGEIMFKAGVVIKGKKINSLDILPRERTDQVKVVWRK